MDHGIGFANGLQRRGVEAEAEGLELVCKAPFVAAPVCFFGDDEAKSKYER